MQPQARRPAAASWGRAEVIPAVVSAAPPARGEPAALKQPAPFHPWICLIDF